MTWAVEDRVNPLTYLEALDPWHVGCLAQQNRRH
jgi:hypothetical protein